MDQHFTTQEIEASASGELPGREDHISSCAICAGKVVATLRMKRAIREAMMTSPAPAALRRRVQRHGTNGATSWLWLVAAMLAAVAILAPFLWRRQEATALPELVDLHGTMLASSNPVDVLSTDRHTVKPWFEGHLPFGVPVPDLTGTPFRLIGGRVVYWRSRQVAYLLIGKGPHRISLFLLPSSQAPDGLGPSPETVSTVRWEDRGLTCIAVADVSRADLEQLRDAFRGH